LARKRVDERKVMDIYNTSGNKAAKEFIGTEYNLAYPNCVITRLRKNSVNGYNKAQDKFLSMQKPPFLELDELCADNRSVSVNKIKDNAINFYDWNSEHELNHMLQKLAMEKLFELTKYVSLSHMTGKCRINKKALESSGYRVEII